MAEHTGIVVVGLGPGDPSLLTIEARDALAAAPEVWLRTSRHPAVTGLPAGPAYRSFDDVYERESNFELVYETIVARVLELAGRPGGVVYAVPGHPLFGEATVRTLLIRAKEAGLALRIVAGVSFVDTVSVAVGLDPLHDGLLIIDALSLREHGRSLVPQRPTLIAQVYDQRAAAHAKLALLEAYPPEHAVRVVQASGTGDARHVDTTVAEMDRQASFDHLSSLYLPPLALPEDVRTFEGARAVVARLRSPDGGCPWDLEQTHESLKRYLIEEAYEALDALDDADPHRLAEELGDLLMQILLQAQVAEDEGEFTVEDVLRSISTKLIRRHPHVFGDVIVSGSEDVMRNWEQLKSEERGDAQLLDAVPKSMPALAQAQSLLNRAEKAGMREIRPSAAAAAAMIQRFGTRDDPDTDTTFGDLMFELVALAGTEGIDAENALRAAIRRFRDDIRRREDERRAG